MLSSFNSLKASVHPVKITAKNDIPQKVLNLLMVMLLLVVLLLFLVILILLAAFLLG